MGEPISISRLSEDELQRIIDMSSSQGERRKAQDELKRRLREIKGLHPLETLDPQELLQDHTIAVTSMVEIGRGMVEQSQRVEKAIEQNSQWCHQESRDREHVLARALEESQKRAEKAVEAHRKQAEKAMDKLVLAAERAAVAAEKTAATAESMAVRTRPKGPTERMVSLAATHPGVFWPLLMVFILLMLMGEKIGDFLSALF